MTTILVTGFEPFAEHARNPSGEIASALADERGVQTAILPVSYARTEQRILELLRSSRPAAVLLLGLHAGPEIRLERVALNLDDAVSPDNDGAIRRNAPIRENGPVGYWSTLPLAAFGRRLDAAGLEWTWSRDAGEFICNHAFYVARHELSQSGREIPCGLVHVPAACGSTLTTTLAGIRDCLAELRAAIRSH